MTAPIEGKQWWIRANQGARQPRPVSLPPVRQNAFVDEDQEAGERLKDAVHQAIDLLTLSLQARIDQPGAMQMGIHDGGVIMVIRQLCDLVHRKAPEFDYAPKRARPQGIFCINCGTRLSPDDAGEWCIHCEDERLKKIRLDEARDHRHRREQRAKTLYRAAKDISREINNLKKAAREKWTPSRQPPTSE